MTALQDQAVIWMRYIQSFIWLLSAYSKPPDQIVMRNGDETFENEAACRLYN
jgi:hypothetical protein